MTKYWGAIEHIVNGEDIYRWYFIHEAGTKEHFAWIMQETMRIPDKFMYELIIGTAYDEDETPEFIMDNWHIMLRGELSYHVQY